MTARLFCYRRRAERFVVAASGVSPKCDGAIEFTTHTSVVNRGDGLAFTTRSSSNTTVSW
jgi:hypothetical protein